MTDEDKLHEEIREWIEEQGFAPRSLDELLYAHDAVKNFMTVKQRREAGALLKRFMDL